MGLLGVRQGVMTGVIQQQKGSDRMLLRQNSKPMSWVTGQARQCFPLHRTSKFWFGPLLSISDEIEYSKMEWDISKSDYVELLKILNHAVIDISLFYRTPPETAYKFLYMVRNLFGIGSQEPAFTGHTITMSQIHFNCNLAFLLLKNRQYAYAYECYESIVDIIRQDLVDTATDVFLIAVSNYLSFAKTHPFIQVKTKIIELVGFLTHIYRILLDKYALTGCAESQLFVLLAVYKQHELHLSKYKGETKILMKKYEDSHSIKDKDKDYSTQSSNENLKLEHYLQKNKSHKVGQIEIKKKELYFTSPLLSLNKNKQKATLNPMAQRHSIQLERTSGIESSLIQSRISQQEDKQLPLLKERTLEIDKGIDRGRQMKDQGIGQKHRGIKERVLESNIKRREVFNNQDEGRKIYYDGNKMLKPSFGSLYQSVQLVSQNQSIQRSLGAKKEKETLKVVDPSQKFFGIDQSLKLKVNFSILNIIKDGIILSDFLQMRKTFITWQEVFIILKNLRFSYVFAQALPICCFYDIGRILSYYVYKADSHQSHGVLVLETPKELVELNMLSKLYFVEGKYLKLFVMSQYDTQHVQIAIDCYFEEFQELFKLVSKNEYIEYINGSIFNIRPISNQNLYAIEAWKKQKETTGLQLSNQLKIHEICEIPYIKSCQFKILLILPRNVQLVLYLREKDFKEEDNLYLPLTVYSLEDRKQSKLKVPMYKLNRYFPGLDPTNTPAWMKRFSKFIFEAYMKCFQDYPYSFNNLQFFNVITYANKIEMIQSGKYFAPITIELVGSSSRIWGLCIRFFQQANVQEKPTFIYNPYYDLLSPVIKQSPGERKKFLITQLVKGSVSETYKILEKEKLDGKMINIKKYWSLIGF